MKKIIKDLFGLFFRYCNNLEYDGTMKLYAKWRMFDIGSKENPLFQCHLLLPPNAVVHDMVIVSFVVFLLKNKKIK